MRRVLFLITGILLAMSLCTVADARVHATIRVWGGPPVYYNTYYYPSYPSYYYPNQYGYPYWNGNGYYYYPRHRYHGFRHHGHHGHW